MALQNKQLSKKIIGMIEHINKMKSYQTIDTSQLNQLPPVNDKLEVCLKDRDKAVGLFKYLKFQYCYPTNVFIQATILLDAFLMRLKVHPKFFMCLVISCFYVAAKLEGCYVNVANFLELNKRKCSVNDIERMSKIVKDKLKLNENVKYINVVDYLLKFIDLIHVSAEHFQIKSMCDIIVKKESLLNHLEVVMCNWECASYKSITLALALIEFEINYFYKAEILGKSSYYSYEMLEVLKVLHDVHTINEISRENFNHCKEKVHKILTNYEQNRRSIQIWPIKQKDRFEKHKILYDYNNYLQTILEE